MADLSQKLLCTDCLENKQTSQFSSMERTHFKLHFHSMLILILVLMLQVSILTLQLMEVVYLTAVSVTFSLGSLFLKNGLELG